MESSIGLFDFQERHSEIHDLQISFVGIIIIIIIRHQSFLKDRDPATISRLRSRSCADAVALAREVSTTSCWSVNTRKVIFWDRSSPSSRKRTNSSFSGNPLPDPSRLAAPSKLIHWRSGWSTSMVRTKRNGMPFLIGTGARKGGQYPAEAFLLRQVRVLSRHRRSQRRLPGPGCAGQRRRDRDWE